MSTNTKAKQARKQARDLEKAQAKKRALIRDIVIIVSAIVIAAAILIAAILSSTPKSNTKRMNVPLSEDGSLHVDKTKLINGFNYINYGGDNDLILYQIADDQVRVAFDTCEECYGYRKVHFNPNGDNMQCSVCETIHPLSDFGLQNWGQCQPVAIPTAARLDTSEQVIIDAKAFEFANTMFAQWDEDNYDMTFAQFSAQ